MEATWGFLSVAGSNSLILGATSNVAHPFLVAARAPCLCRRLDRRVPFCTQRTISEVWNLVPLNLRMVHSALIPVSSGWSVD